MDDAARKPDRSLVIVIGVVAVLVVIALIVVFTRPTAERADESTPAGAVQRYAEAVIAGDLDTARGLLTSELQSACEETDPGSLSDVRLVLSKTTERDRTADVEVEVVNSSTGGLFGPSEYRSEERFGLVEEDGRWAIEAAPWQFTICTEQIR